MAMKRMISRIQELGQKASQIKQAVESAPAKAAEIREAVVMTASQFHQLGAEIQSSVVGLQVENDERLIQAMGEINASTSIFHGAGYDLLGVDIELGLVQKLIVRLEKVADVSRSTLHSLLTASQNRKTTHALISAIIKAEELAGKVELTNLTYQELVVHVGPTPAVRICWRPKFIVEKEQPPAPPPLPTAAETSFFSQSSSFEQPTQPPTSATQKVRIVGPRKPLVLPADVAASKPVASVPEPSPVTPGDWKRNALDRFKKMPDLSKLHK